MSDRQNTYPQLTPADLKDPTLTRVNANLNFLFSQVAKIQLAAAVAAKASGGANFGNGNVGQVLTSNGSGPPTFQDLPQNSHLIGSGTLTLTNSYADITGATITLDKAGTWAVLGIFDFLTNVTSAGAFGILVYDGTPQTAVASLIPTTAMGTDTIEATVPGVWIIANTGSKVAKLQAKKGGAGGSAAANTSYILGIWLHP